MCAARLSIPRRSASRSSVPRSIERHPAVGLRRAHRRHQHAGAGREAAEAAHDVAELLEPEVAREPGLGDDVVGELQRDPVLDDRVVRVGDVAERPGVDQHRLALERLDQVRLDRVLHHDGHRPRHPEVLGGDRRRRRGSTATTIRPRRARRSCRSVASARIAMISEAAVITNCALARDAVRLAAEPDDRVAQLAVVHVERPRPGDRLRVDAERVAVEDRGVERRREQVVGGRDRVEVAVEVEVDLLHRHDLGVAAAGAAALDPEHRAHRGLAQAQHHVLADLAQALRERDRGGGLALAGLRRRDRRGDDQLAVGPVGQPVEDRERDFPLPRP